MTRATTTISIDATGVRSTRSSSVADFNETRHSAARSENKFYGRSTARSHVTNVTSYKTKHAPNSFRHSVSESKQIKKAINFSVWRKFIQFQKANENFDGFGDFEYALVENFARVPKTEFCDVRNRTNVDRVLDTFGKRGLANGLCVLDVRNEGLAVAGSPASIVLAEVVRFAFAF